MKKLYLTAFCLAAASAIYAQSDYVTPATIEYFYAQKVNPAGTAVVGQDPNGLIILSYDPATEEVTVYEDGYPGNGNCVADNGMIVGQGLSTDPAKAVVCWKGNIVTPGTLAGAGYSSLDGITPDGSRACGYMFGNTTTQGIVPFVVDITPDGSFGRAKALPFPRRDLFGDTPQFVNAVWISDDGKTVAGSVMDGSGFYMYPIIFKEAENGTWSYFLPTESFFNPQGLPLPESPDGNIVWGENGAPAQPKAEDFLTPEQREEWLKHPNQPAYNFLEGESEAAYNRAIQQFGREADEYIDKKMDEYWRQMALLGRNEQFAPNMALSPDGKKLMVLKGVTEDDMTSDIMTGYIPYIFDTETGDYEVVKVSSTSLIIPTQFLSDGSVLAMSSPDDFMPFVSYILLPGANEFIKFSDYLEDTFPSYYPWLEDTLGSSGVIGFDPATGETLYGDYIITGWISVSRNWGTIAGGYPVGDMLTYVYYDPDKVDGVDSFAAPEAEEEGDGFIYNLQGIRVSNPAPGGIYIRNGKKIIF